MTDNPHLHAEQKRLGIRRALLHRFGADELYMDYKGPVLRMPQQQAEALRWEIADYIDTFDGAIWARPRPGTADEEVLRGSIRAMEREKEEFVYFRAAGKSLRILKGVERREQKRLAIEKAVLDRFGGEQLALMRDWAGMEMSGKRAKDLGWEVVYRHQDDSGKVTAAPRPGTADDKVFQEAVGTLMREKLFPIRDYGEYFKMDKSTQIRLSISMSLDNKAPGYLSDAFVKSHMKTESEGFRAGALKDHFTGPVSERGLAYGWQQIDSMKMGGDYYIRVPSPEMGREMKLWGEKPFVPPDAVPVSLGEMLELDRQEYLRRQALDEAKDMLAKAAKSPVRAAPPAPRAAKTPATPKTRGLA